MFTTIATMLASLQASVSAEPVTYKPYTNARFGYHTCVPADFRVYSDPVNQDGKIWTSRDGATLTTWGSYNLEDESAVSQMRYYLNPQDKVTYGVAKHNWAVVSGVRGRSIFWRKLVKQGDRIIGIEMRYPVTMRDRYDAVTIAISKCSRPL